MREIHGTSNALAVKPYNDLRGGSHVMRGDHRKIGEIEKGCDKQFSGEETSSKIDNDRPIMFVQFIQMWSSQMLSSDK